MVTISLIESGSSGGSTHPAKNRAAKDKDTKKSPAGNFPFPNIAAHPLQGKSHLYTVNVLLLRCIDKERESLYS
jgi:hypothetical protein